MKKRIIVSILSLTTAYFWFFFLLEYVDYVQAFKPLVTNWDIVNSAVLNILMVVFGLILVILCLVPFAALHGFMDGDE